MSNPYEELFIRKVQVVPGSFRCGYGQGLRVEIIGRCYNKDVEIKIGGKERQTFRVSKKTAEILRDFFDDLVETF